MRVLILGGTTEARELAEALHARGDEVTALAQYQLGDVLGSAFGPALVGGAVTASASGLVNCPLAFCTAATAMPFDFA